jgi:hypothetical protein
MAHRKNIEYQLEKACEFWGDTVKLTLVNSNCVDYVWNLEHDNTVYEITYSDSGEIAVNALSNKSWPKSQIREVYVGDNSQSSYQNMISALSNNFSYIM